MDYWVEGLIPFAPMAHCTNVNPPPYNFLPCSADPTNLGLKEDGASTYALRWSAPGFTRSFNKFDGTYASIGDMGNWCTGDSSDQAWATSVGNAYTAAMGAGGTASDMWTNGRGYWETGEVGNTKDRRDLIYGAMGAPVRLGDDFSGKEPEVASAIKNTLNEKVASGDRLFYGPVVDPMTGDIIGFRQFELVQQPPYGAGNSYWCAKYRGAALYGLGTNPAMNDGVYQIRLVR
jgi:hypothetical protein